MSFFSADYAEIFFVEELKSVSILLDSVLIGFSFTYTIYNAPAPVFIKAWQVIFSMFIVTAGSDRVLPFCKKEVFIFLTYTGVVF